MKVVIVGGGIAGVASALELQNKSGIEVQLLSGSEYMSVDRFTLLSGPAAEPYSVTGIFSSSENVSVSIDQVVAINSRFKAVKTASGAIYPYDKLLFSAEHDPADIQVPGVVQYTHMPYDVQGEQRLKSTLTELFRIPHRNEVSAIVVGAGPMGVGITGSLQVYACEIAHRYGIAPKHVRVELIEQARKVLPAMDERASEKAQKRLQKHGVVLRLGNKVTHCTQHVVALGTEERAADVIIWAAGMELPALFSKYPEVFTLQSGKVLVDDMLRVPKAPDIHVLGSNAYTAYSGVAQTALYDAVFVTKLIMGGSGVYRPRNPWTVVPIGERWALAQKQDKLRSGRMGWAMRSRVAKRVRSYFKKRIH